MRDTKNLESYSKEKEKENKQQNLFKNLRKEVETGANGTQKYVIKKGANKGKIAMLSEELVILNKIQKYLKESYQNIGDNMIGGGIDNMEKYKYMMGQAHAYLRISQEISSLLNPKEEKNDTEREHDLTNVVRFGDTQD
jgi:hypothetical protein